MWERSPGSRNPQGRGTLSVKSTGYKANVQSVAFLKTNNKGLEKEIGAISFIVLNNIYRNTPNQGSKRHKQLPIKNTQ